MLIPAMKSKNRINRTLEDGEYHIMSKVKTVMELLIIKMFMFREMLADNT